ncbi:MAG: c-type cytochrome [Salinarimonas sp.]
MRLRLSALALAALPWLGASGPAAAQDVANQDVANGRAIAERWCAACHLVSPDQQTAMDGVPSFRAIAARGALGDDALRAFLVDPHPVMPDMALTREEIADLSAYVDSLAE